MTTEAWVSGFDEPNRTVARAAGSALRGLLRHWRLAALDLSTVVLAGALDVAAKPSLPGAVTVMELGATTMLCLLLAGTCTGLYGDRYSQTSFEDLTALWGTVTATTLVVLLADMTLAPRMSGSEIVEIGAVSLVLMTAVRGCARVRHERACCPSSAPHRALVFGAGEAGENLLRVLRHSPDSEIVPVAVLDDDAAKIGRRVAGVRVVGGRQQLARAAHQYQADTLLIAVASRSRELVADIGRLAEPLGLSVKVLPPLEELLLGLAEDHELRPLEPAQLLGRREVVFELATVAEHLAGKRVLVTGAGGSSGSELCRQLSDLGVGELIMLDRDETALHDVQLSLDGRGLLDDNGLVVADIRDRHRLDDIFAARLPQVVFHAAALKHLPLLQMYPTEAVKTNIWGTQNVLDSAMRFGVERFVNISTDKAANAVSVLGWSKRIGERLTAAAAEQIGRPFVSVRFGNVLGSRGSVLTAFEAQIVAGGPVAVTHPQVTRYFMTVQEAVRLVIQASAIGAPGEALVLDMGEPVKIDDVARRLTGQADRAIEIVYTGLRPGEKLHEELLGDGELDLRPHHPLISQVGVPSLEPSMLVRLNGVRDRGRLIDALRDLASVTIDLTVPDQRDAWDRERLPAVGA
ncbi:MAG: nucleoside-diphosphate sugar epimerase/dehydratase [Mycobacteriales bacterium]